MDWRRFGRRGFCAYRFDRGRSMTDPSPLTRLRASTTLRNDFLNYNASGRSVRTLAALGLIEKRGGFLRHTALGQTLALELRKNLP